MQLYILACMATITTLTVNDIKMGILRIKLRLDRTYLHHS